MTDGSSLLAHPLVPVASEEDAEHTLAAALPRIRAAGGRMTVLHVVEKAGGAPDKASVEQRQELAEEMFTLVRERAAAAGVDVDTDITYATDVVEGILDEAHDVGASAIVFTPRGGKRWWDLFSGDISERLLEESDMPVVMLPDVSTVDDAVDTDDTDDASEVTEE